MNTYVIRGLDENSRKVKIEIEAEELEEAVLISKKLCTTVNSVELFDKKQVPKHTTTEGKNPLGCGCFPFSQYIKQREDGKYHNTFTKEKFKKDFPKFLVIGFIVIILGFLVSIFQVEESEKKRSRWQESSEKENERWNRLSQYEKQQESKKQQELHDLWKLGHQ